MRTGVAADTWGVLTGWDHVVQSLGKIVTTRLNTRTCRRHLGSLVPDIQDANANADTVFRLYASIAEAIEDERDGEPGFVLRNIELVAGGRDGRFGFILEGDYFPFGHLRDFGTREEKQTFVPMAPAPGTVTMIAGAAS